ncbi:hypothetical protein SAMN05192541_13394 [Bradyrhizobium arachidis]|uniref:Uncharacterized protein n=1 Tax=Bradyrhizobium arachidis TaxID=858423 RepID=A0AAE7NY58_9BRAD|nr:hypothetical protein WN72_19390 [Bradyrhizobium arachidis]SFV18273.1 hypothetical protein SAMN05192541_13394 [Bradyrhizobium arachidis]
MQIHLKAYLQLISRLRHFRALPPRNRDPGTQHASPLLVYVVAVLALLLAALEVDVHRARLQSVGLVGDPIGIAPIFMSP